jgi:hypothetical protein
VFSSEKKKSYGPWKLVAGLVAPAVRPVAALTSAL